MVSNKRYKFWASPSLFNQSALNGLIAYASSLFILMVGIPDLGEAILAPMVMLAMALVITSLSFSSFWLEEKSTGFLDFYISEKMALEPYVLKTLVSAWLTYMPLVLMFSALSLLLGSCSFRVIGALSVAVILCTLSALALNMTLSALMLASASSEKGVMNGVLMAPLMLPSLFLSLRSIELAQSAEPFIQTSLILGGVTLILVALSLLLTPFALRLAIR